MIAHVGLAGERPPFEKTPEIDVLFQHARKVALEIGFELADTFTGGSDGNCTAARDVVVIAAAAEGMTV